jgi:cytochrome c2
MMPLRALQTLVAVALVFVSGCGAASKNAVDTAFSAQAQSGQRLIQTYGCGACHAIPGIPGAIGTVGPPLNGFAGRVMIAGRLPNDPDNLVRWIAHPQDVSPGSDMPDLGVSDADAARIAAYLYGLQ